MSLKQRLSSALRALRGNQTRGFRDITSVGGQNGDWLIQSLSDDADLWQNVYALTDRVMDLFKTNPLYIKYRDSSWANIFGENGILLRMKIVETETRTIGGSNAAKEANALIAYENRINRLREWAEKKTGTEIERYRAFKLADGMERSSSDAVIMGRAQIQVGSPDVFANLNVEKAKFEWSRAENCDVRGYRNEHVLRQLRLISAIKCGDVFIRHIRDPKVNKFGYANQLISAKWCDHFLNETLPNGNVIIMGIEYQMNPWGLGKPVNFYFLKRQPADWKYSSGGMFGYQGGKLHTVVPAEEIIHYARPVDADATRPAPWVASTIPKGRQLDQYELSEVIAAREHACQTGFLYSDIQPEGGFAGATPDPVTGLPATKLAPGETGALPYGVKYQGRSAEHPSQNFPAFRKGMGQSISAGMPGADYNTLFNDLENINFSAGRLGRLDTNEMSKMIQRFDIDTAERPVFEAWLEAALINGAINLPLVKFQKFNKPIFQGRRWQDVDETKAVNSAALRIANKLSSRGRECAEEGIDFEENVMELAEEEMLMESVGLTTETTVEHQPKPTEAADAADGATAPTGGTQKPSPTKKPGAKAAEPEGEKDMTETELNARLDAFETKILRVLDTPKTGGREISASQPMHFTFPPIENRVEVDMSKFKLPEQKAPNVTVEAAQITIPAQKDLPAPVVHVNVPAPVVNVENKIDVPTASSIDIKRNKKGEMTGATVNKS